MSDDRSDDRLSLCFRCRIVLVSNLISFTPFISLLLIHAVLQESIQVVTIGGLTLIVIGNVIQKTGMQRRNT